FFRLILDNTLGISFILWISIKLGLCVMPEKSNIKQLTGVGMLAGIGFTMSIFIALLSFPGNELLGAEAKFAILCASLVSGLIGSLTLISIAKKTQRKEKPRP